jgi:hypothetical protein
MREVKTLCLRCKGAPLRKATLQLYQCPACCFCFHSQDIISTSNVMYSLIVEIEKRSLIITWNNDDTSRVQYMCESPSREKIIPYLPYDITVDDLKTYLMFA